MSDDFIGPAPPPHLAQSVNGEQKRKKEEREQEEPKQETKRSGPASPPRKRRRMGPSLDDLVAPPPPQEVMIGPPLPDNLAPSGSEEPEDLDRQWDEVLKRNATTSGAEKKGKREDWMLSLPQSRQQRIPTQSVKSFAKNEVQSSDNSWTLAPGEKAQTKNSEEKRAPMPTRTQAPPRRPAGPSLLEMHQQKMNSASNQREERGGWDRERDFLGVGKTMSASKRKEIIDQAGEINSRFARSTQ